MTFWLRCRTKRLPRGMTLLEVLVACGILVVGLASIAALLPAAGSRLGQASREDRAGNLASNALAQARSAGVIASDVFANRDRAVAIGPGIGTLATVDPSRFAAAAPELAQRIDATRGFLLEDEVVFGSPTTAATPVNDFTDGLRTFKEGLCWGGTIVPTRFPAVSGTAATFSVAVSRRAPTARSIPLEKQAAGVYRMASPDESVRGKFLRGCSYVVVPPTDATKGPRWYRIAASWKVEKPSFQAYVAFDGIDVESFAGNSPTVIGFDTLIRVDEHQVILK